MNEYEKWLWGIGIVLLVASIATLYALAGHSGKIHRKLREIRAQAENASTIFELEGLWIHLTVYCRDNAWHVSHSTHAKEVISYIQGKLDGMKK